MVNTKTILSVCAFLFCATGFSEETYFLETPFGTIALPIHELSEAEAERLAAAETEDMTLAELGPKKSEPVSLKSGMSEVKRQGERLTCNAFAAIGLLEYYHSGHNFSEQCLSYFSSGRDSEYVDVRLRYAISHGLYLEADCPYKYSPSERDVIPPLKRGSIFWPDDHFVFDSLGGQSVVDFVKAKIDAGHPVILDVVVAGKKWDYSGDHIIRIPSKYELAKACRKGKKPRATAGKWKKCGIHSIVIVGYDDGTRAFEFRNSWGDGFGMGGYGKISYRYAETLRVNNAIAKRGGR